MKLDTTMIDYGDGTVRWWCAYGLHRVDGPAVMKANGYRGWWLYGHRYEPMEWMLKVHELGLEDGNIERR